MAQEYAPGIEPSANRARSVLALLALASGVGLVGLVGYGLWNAVEQGRARADLDARTDARELARALRTALRSPEVLELVPEPDRFEVRAGAVTVPLEVGWLHARPAVVPDPAVLDKLRRARVAEFGHGDAVAASALYDDLLGPRGPGGDVGLEVRAAAAWQAHRTGAGERCEGLAVALDAEFAGAGPARNASVPFGRAVASTVLLGVAMGREPFAWQEQLVASLPEDLARPVVARMAERGADVARLRAAADACAARRRMLVAVQRTASVLGDTSVAFGVEGGLVLWFPGADGDGFGARASPRFVAELHRSGTARTADVAGLPAMPEGGQVVFELPATPHAEDVVPGLVWVVPTALPDAPLLARPEAVVAGAMVLVLVFVASALVGVRALRREALAMRVRAEFLTGVTHELKTPVASIRLIADALIDDPVEPPRQRTYFGLLGSESARLSMLIDNVLDLGQMERGERAYDLRPVDVAEVVREAVAAFRPMAERDGLDVALDEGVASVDGTIDRGAMVQALLNVLDNARKYAASGGRVEVSTLARDGRFEIAVRDFGPGVPDGERAAIFERFRRGAVHRHGSIPGVGLGLHLARAIARRHGGALVCEAAAEGPGAVFRLTVPLDGGMDA